MCQVCGFALFYEACQGCGDPICRCDCANFQTLCDVCQGDANESYDYEIIETVSEEAE
jgi:hypothetical protein